LNRLGSILIAMASQPRAYSSGASVPSQALKPVITYALDYEIQGDREDRYYSLLSFVELKEVLLMRKGEK
jgi:hypothetical protein